VDTNIIVITKDIQHTIRVDVLLLLLANPGDEIYLYRNVT